MTVTTRPYLFQPGSSEQRWMGDTATYFLATGALTDGAFALVDECALQGEAVPLHRHSADEESFYVLEGELAFFLDQQPAQRLTAGGFVHIPADSVHGFRVESPTARYLILTTPHHGDFYRAISLPTAHAPVSDEIIMQACEQYGVEFIGPLPP